MIISTATSLTINTQVNQNNDIKTIIIIALVNAIVIPLINILGSKLREFLHSIGLSDKEALKVEIRLKRETLKQLKKIEPANELIKLEMDKEIHKLEREIENLEERLKVIG